jgi:hypothetical protein
MIMKTVLSAALAGILVSAGLATAHEGHEHKAMGTVAAVDAKHIEVADKDGKKTSIQLAPDTKYLHGTMAAEASHVKVGQRVVVVYVENEKDKTSVAKQVLLGVTEKDPAPAKPHEHH